MIRLRAIHTLAAIAIVVIFLTSTALVFLENFNLFTAALFSFLNIIGATFPPNQSLVNARSPLILTAVAIGIVGNIAFTIIITTIFYQILSSMDARYFISKQRVRRMTKHFIITPINGMGIELAKKIREQRIGVVFVDTNKLLVKRMLRSGFLAIHGDATLQETLSEASAERAITLFALHDDDIKNTFVTIAAKKANKRILIVSRIKRLDDIPKIERAGARRVILPEAAIGIEIGEFLMANT